MGLLGAGALLVSTAALGGLAWRVTRQAERRHPPIGRFLEVDGLRVHYAEWGEGPPVVLLHGNGTMVDDWLISGFTAVASRQFRVIAIDRPGYGYTSRPRNRVWTAEAQADLIRKTLARLGVDSPVVVGHSWGAIVSLALALNHPDSIRGLVLLGGYYFPTHRLDVWAFSPPAIPVIGDVMRYTVSPPIMRWLAPKIIRASFAPRPVPEQFSAYFPLDLALRPSQLRASAADSALMIPCVASLSRRYAQLRLPLVILSGDADQVVTPERQSMRLHQELPHSALKLLPGIGHMVHYFAHKDILDALTVIMERARATARTG
jgi:pimeloyl-ACP methyl ester carboxylesterase